MLEKWKLIGFVVCIIVIAGVIVFVVWDSEQRRLDDTYPTIAHFVGAVAVYANKNPTVRIVPVQKIVFKEWGLGTRERPVDLPIFYSFILYKANAGYEFLQVNLFDKPTRRLAKEVAERIKQGEKTDPFSFFREGEYKILDPPVGEWSVRVKDINTRRLHPDMIHLLPRTLAPKCP